jgi:hypothetical protein
LRELELITIRALNYLLQGWESYAAIMLVCSIVREVAFATMPLGKNLREWGRGGIIGSIVRSKWVLSSATAGYYDI